MLLGHRQSVAIYILGSKNKKFLFLLQLKFIQILSMKAIKNKLTYQSTIVPLQATVPYQNYISDSTGASVCLPLFFFSFFSFLPPFFAARPSPRPSCSHGH
ncbi:hypothetical protein ACKWTF_013616 [Chironomus riparius]